MRPVAINVHAHTTFRLHCIKSNSSAAELQQRTATGQPAITTSDRLRLGRRLLTVHSPGKVRPQRNKSYIRAIAYRNSDNGAVASRVGSGTIAASGPLSLRGRDLFIVDHHACCAPKD